MNTPKLVKGLEGLATTSVHARTHAQTHARAPARPHAHARTGRWFRICARTARAQRNGLGSAGLLRAGAHGSDHAVRPWRLLVGMGRVRVAQPAHLHAPLRARGNNHSNGNKDKAYRTEPAGTHSLTHKRTALPRTAPFQQCAAERARVWVGPVGSTYRRGMCQTVGALLCCAFILGMASSGTASRC